jgi:penicillin-binding protein 2
MEIRVRRRIVWLSAVVLLMMAGLGGRLFAISVGKGAEYTRMAYRQRTLTLPVAGSRGQILDRHGALLSDSMPAWRVAVFPPLVQDRAKAAEVLAGALATPETPAWNKVWNLAWDAMAPKAEPSWLDRTLSEAQAAKVRLLNLPGVAVGRSAGRYGPEALARHLVGYLNAQGGQLGLEQFYNRELSGEAPPALTAVLDGLGHPIDEGAGIRLLQPATGKPPANVYTTLDAQIQMEVDRVLDRKPAQRAAAVVMDPVSGEVLAMASRPQFEYATLGDLLTGSGSGDILLNRALAAYEPGSIFKPIVAAAALEQGLVRPSEEFFCAGHVAIGGHMFTEASGGHGALTFQEAIARSCNVTFLDVGYERLGADGIRAAARQFGLGSRTGVLGSDWADDLAGAIPGSAGGADPQMAFGQGGLMVTPLQIARAYAAIANGGTLPPVRLVDAIKSPAGEVLKRPAAGRAKRIISRETAAALQKALGAVTDPKGDGTGREAWIPGVGSAGKTGSAETGRTEKGQSVVHAWFAGYFPQTRPRYVVVVLVENGQYGGQAAAPIFREIGKAIVNAGL